MITPTFPMSRLILAIVFSIVLSATFLTAHSKERRVPANRSEMELSFAPLLRDVTPAVVNVYTTKIVQVNTSPFAGDPFFERFGFPGMMRERMQNSLGSGVIVGEDGIVVTNNHVISGGQDLRVVLSDRREFAAELILADEKTDLAVLKFDPDGEKLPKLDFANTRDVEVGDLVLAIGNPFGVGQTVTSGIISATARTYSGVSDSSFFIQTDAAVNPGNSGGALVNTNGELVGVNTAIYSQSGGSNGIGLAIPSEMVRRVVDAAVNEGSLLRPWLGLKGQSVTYDIAKAKGLERPVGVLITEVYDGGPADLAGLKRGDMVITIDGHEIFDDAGLKFFAAVFAPGEQTVLRIFRDGRERNVKIRLALPPGTSATDLVLLSGQNPFSGAEIAALSPALAEQLGLDLFSEGIFVTRIQRGAYAWRVIKPGDMIISINGVAVSTVDDIVRLLEQADGGRNWQIELQRNGQRITGTVIL